MSNAEQIETIAADWLARRDNGRWTEQEQRSLDAWLQAATAHRIAYLRLDSAWRGADRLVEAAPEAHEVSRPRRWERFSPRRIAAGLALAGAAALFAGYYSSPAPQQNYATAVGENRTLALADGSRLTLNTGTRVRAQVGADARKVWLDGGEAYFDIAHDAAHPFVVEAGASRITVLGTRFVVRREGDAIKVAVAEGKVRVEQAGRQVLLLANDTALADSRQIATSRKTPAQLGQLLSWREGRLVMDQLTLAQAAGEFNRYNRRQLVIADPALSGMVIGGSFAPENVDGFARLLQQGFGLRVDNRDDKIIISR
jgi:transmembrane sensor